MNLDTRPTTTTLPPEAEIVHNVILRAIAEQMNAVGGPPTRTGMAWSILHAIYAAGWRFVPERDGDEA